MTAYSISEQPHRAVNECRLLEQAMQVLEQYPVLKEKPLGYTPQWVDELKLEFVDLDPAEISGIWEHQDSPGRLSVVYRVYPVEIPRSGGKIIAPVKEVDYGTKTD
jgi:hypothetical protein